MRSQEVPPSEFQLRRPSVKTSTPEGLMALRSSRGVKPDQGHWEDPGSFGTSGGISQKRTAWRLPGSWGRVPKKIIVLGPRMKFKREAFLKESLELPGASFVREMIISGVGDAEIWVF